jgi:hypothetical protein
MSSVPSLTRRGRRERRPKSRRTERDTRQALAAVEEAKKVALTTVVRDTVNEALAAASREQEGGSGAGRHTHRGEPSGESSV